MIKCHKKSQKSKNQGFSYFYCLMMEGSGSVQIMTDPDGPKTYIRMNNTGKKLASTFSKKTAKLLSHRNTRNDIEIHII